MSNFCVACERGPKAGDPKNEEFRARHKDDCAINHDGTAGAMEVEAAKIIWNRPVDSGLHYTTMLRDGDSKAFDAVKNCLWW